MPIEFRCDQCQRLLRVPDQNAGARARCPQCSHVQEVPFASTVTGDSAGMSSSNPPASGAPGTFGGSSWPAAQQPTPGVGSPVSSNPFADMPERNPFAENPYQSPYAAGFQSTVSLRDSALSKVKAPAIILIILAVLATGLLLLGMTAGIIEIADKGADNEDLTALAMLGVGVLMQTVVLVGMARMLALKNYGLALTGAILSMVCGFCSLLTLPFSIWALVVLCDSNVRSQFS